MLNFTRVIFGFTVVLYQTKWADAVGNDWSFGTQAIICGFAFVLIPIMQKYAKKWRDSTSLDPDV